MPMLRNCDVCSEKYGVGDPRNWHEPEHWPSECMDHYRKRKGEDRIGLQIMKDIEPYKAVGLPGQPVIGSRRHHKDAMRAHGMVEVGNEKVEKKYEAPPGLREDLKRAIDKNGGWH
jgi:hypothetical protein